MGVRINVMIGRVVHVVAKENREARGGGAGGKTLCDLRFVPSTYFGKVAGGTTTDTRLIKKHGQSSCATCVRVYQDEIGATS